MSATKALGSREELRRVVCALAVGAVGLTAGACAQVGLGSAQLSPGPDKALKATAADGRSDLQRATEYWGQAYGKNPHDAQAAVNYARNLKALGEKRQALAVMQQASALHGGNRAIAGEYGRLALEFDQVSLAERLLQAADDPVNPDWKVISARGTALAKQNKYREAIAFYEKALLLAPNQASILNNLALAYAMNGNAAKAEELLAHAAGAGGGDGRINQNLALVLSLQGKYDEAKLAGGRNLPSDSVVENVEYLRHMVKLEPKEGAQASGTGKAKLAATGSVPALKGRLEGGASADPADGWTSLVATIKSER